MAIGSYALSGNHAGNKNAAVGSFAAYSNDEADNNTAIGYQALYSNDHGDYNTAIGAQALYNAMDIGSTSVPFGVIPATKNTAVGYRSLYGITGGGNNTALGESAGSNLTTGSYNIAIGRNTTFTDTAINGALNIGNVIFGVDLPNPTITSPSAAPKIGIGTSNPQSAFAVVGLPVYADNTAALAGGLVIGDFYRTSTGVLMVVY